MFFGIIIFNEYFLSITDANRCKSIDSSPIFDVEEKKKKENKTKVAVFSYIQFDFIFPIMIIWHYSSSYFVVLFPFFLRFRLDSKRMIKTEARRVKRLKALSFSEYI